MMDPFYRFGDETGGIPPLSKKGEKSVATAKSQWGVDPETLESYIEAEKVSSCFTLTSL